MGLLSALSRSRLGALGRARQAAQKGFAADAAAEVPQWPVRPVRQIGPGGMPIGANNPTARALDPRSEDLLEAARMIRPEDFPQFMALLSGGMSITAALETMTGGGSGGQLQTQETPGSGATGGLSY